MKALIQGWEISSIQGPDKVILTGKQVGGSREKNTAIQKLLKIIFQSY
jgi:hypothetical protein